MKKERRTSSLKKIDNKYYIQLYDDEFYLYNVYFQNKHLRLSVTDAV